MQAVKGLYLFTHGHLKGFHEYLRKIVEFSELGDFILLTMKGYSEGMSARLSFSLLTSGSHDCLALDEGFGTGDARFFERAQRRLEHFIETAGILILASHSGGLLQQLCQRGLVFNQGEIVFDGSLHDSLRYYHEQCCLNATDCVDFTPRLVVYCNTTHKRAVRPNSTWQSFWLGLSNLLSIGVLATVYGTVFKVKDFGTYVVIPGTGLVIWNATASSVQSAPGLFRVNAVNIKNTNIHPHIFYLCRMLLSSSDVF